MAANVKLLSLAASAVSSAAERNSFSLPWNESDVILVVQGWDLHVHRSILSLQSPVFKAMLCGQFREATAERIPLAGKTHKWMLLFLRLLYPPNMIRNAKVVITDENVFEILKLADEYQAVNVVSQCLEDITVTNKNVLQLLPYAVRHDQSALPKLTKRIESSISVEKLEKFTQELADDKVAHQLLVAKGCHLEKVVCSSSNAIQKLLYIMGGKKEILSVKCGHTVNTFRYGDAQKCMVCIDVYRTKFINEAIQNTLGNRLKEPSMESLLNYFANLMEELENLKS